MHDEVVIDAPAGRFRAIVADGLVHARGIPYARAGRLEAPVAADQTARELDATRRGRVAPQVPLFGPIGEIFGSDEPSGEQCLSVDVTAPCEPGEPRPVLVWIHGGGFAMGSGTHPLYGSGAFARLGMVEVHVNHRLGILGFGHVDDAPAPDNRALLDLVAALRWVADNVAAFGGDPSRVTVAGHSAGAMSAACLLASPHAQGLFARAILQSGAASNVLPRTAAAAVTACALGPGVTASDIASTPLERLLDRQRDACRDVVGLAERAGLRRFPAGCPWQPVIDGDVVPAAPLAQIAAGAGKDVPLLIGTVADELWLSTGTRFAGVLAMGDLEAVVAASLGVAGASVRTLVDRARERRPAGTAARLLADILGEVHFREPVKALVDARAADGSLTFQYVFDAPKRLIGGEWATPHGSELPYLFSSSGSRAGRRLVGDVPTGAGARLRDIWASFIASPDLADWGWGTSVTEQLGLDGMATCRPPHA